MGRVAEVAEVERLLTPGRVLTLTGVGGAGKTRIARRVTVDLGATFPAGVWVVELADLVDPALLAEVVAGALELQIPPGDRDGSVLADYLAGRPGLLVLDNCEHVIDGVAELTALLLAACPGLTVLATSRFPLGISLETVYQVPPLSAPETNRPVDVDQAYSFDSVALYVQRAGEALPTFRLTSENVRAVSSLVARLEGVPLAIELAAARVRHLGPDSLLDRIADRFDALQTDLRDVPARQRSLSASLGWSYDLCRADERELWNRLSVFTGGFELEAAEGVCSGEGISQGAVLDLLAVLVDMSVVVRIGETGSRFRMLEPIRQYGADRLAESGHARRWQDRHLAWYAGLVDRLASAWVGPDQLTWMDRLRAEHPNLRTALEHALDDPSTALVALRICRGLKPMWFCGGHFSEARRWIERAVALTEGEAAEKVMALRLCTWFAALQLDLPYAHERLDEAAGLLEPDDTLVRGHYLFADGIVATWEQDFDRGIPLLTESLACFRAAGYTAGTLEALVNIAVAHVLNNDHERARAVGQECLEITDPLGETYIGGYARWALGLGMLINGELQDATAMISDALGRSTSLGDQFAMALELETLAWLAAIQFDFDRATTVLGGAELIWRMASTPVEKMPGVRDFRAEGVRQVRETIGDAAFDGGFSKGLAMRPGDVVDFALGVAPVSPETRKAGPLSRRETEVAALVAEGLTNRDIAERLFLSERTAQGHVQSILRKLVFGSRSQIAVWYVDQVRGPAQV